MGATKNKSITISTGDLDITLDYWRILKFEDAPCEEQVKAWEANTVYSAGKKIKGTGAYTGFWFEGDGGTSHATTEPTWTNTVGAVDTDNDINWTNIHAPHVCKVTIVGYQNRSDYEAFKNPVIEGIIELSGPDYPLTAEAQAPANTEARGLIWDKIVAGPSTGTVDFFQFGTFDLSDSTPVLESGQS